MVGLWSLRRVEGREKRFKRFTLVALALFHAYLLKIGGDFMYGRFFVSLLPMLMLCLERFVCDLPRRRPWDALTALALLCSTFHGVQLVRKGRIDFELSDESTVYPLLSVHPVRIRHRSFRTGNYLHETLTSRGMEPVLATWGIGMVAYYSELELIDIAGLTDATVARQVSTTRGRPGHEKYANVRYLLQRGAHFSTRPLDGRYTDLTRISSRARPRSVLRDWHLLHYDGRLMSRIARDAPDVVFVDMRAYLEQYASSIGPLDPEVGRRDLAFFDAYYFDHNPGSADLRETISAALEKTP